MLMNYSSQMWDTAALKIWQPNNPCRLSGKYPKFEKPCQNAKMAQKLIKYFFLPACSRVIKVPCILCTVVWSDRSQKKKKMFCLFNLESQTKILTKIRTIVMKCADLQLFGDLKAWFLGKTLFHEWTQHTTTTVLHKLQGTFITLGHAGRKSI